MQGLQAHTSLSCTKAIHQNTRAAKSTKALYKSYTRQRLHIVRLEACKLHSANLSLHSQPLIHPTLPHSPVCRGYSTPPFPWCLCIRPTVAHALSLSPHLWPLIHSPPVSLCNRNPFYSFSHHSCTLATFTSRKFINKSDITEC